MMDYALFVRNFFILVALNSLGVLETSDRCLRSFGACWRGVFSQEVFKSARLKEWGPLGPKRQRQWCRKHLEVAIKLCESTTKEKKKRRKLSARGRSGNTCWTTWEWSRVDRRWVSWPYHVDFLCVFLKKKISTDASCGKATRSSLSYFTSTSCSFSIAVNQAGPTASSASQSRETKTQWPNSTTAVRLAYLLLENCRSKRWPASPEETRLRVCHLFAESCASPQNNRRRRAARLVIVCATRDNRHPVISATALYAAQGAFAAKCCKRIGALFLSSPVDSNLFVFASPFSL